MLDTFDAPLLRMVSLEGHVLPSSIRLPWVQLTHFMCDELSLGDCTRVLQDCPLLKTCVFTGVKAGGAGILSHAALESLTIDLYHIGVDVRLLALPALRELSLAYWPVYTARDFLLALNRAEDSQFLPCLSSLTLSLPFEPGLALSIDTPVMNALRSRYVESNDAKLKSLRLLLSNSYNYNRIYRESIEDVDWDAMYDLWDLGMDIHVREEGKEENFLFHGWSDGEEDIE
ncbi:hypothetical protein C8R43DRAFT_978689 [Mycena crocata]|nr:hypothetical protein C8R43DRAFT_978689 [Mycena crocata]